MSYSRGQTSSRGTSEQNGTQTTTPQRTAEQTELDKIALGQAREFDPTQRQLNQNSGDLINQLLQGKSLPGYLNGLPGGISSDVTQGIVDSALRDIQPGMQRAGLLDSGVNASISARTSADIRNQSAQFNIQNLMQLLNLGVGGQAQVQQPILSQTNMLGQRLSGITPVTTTSSGINTFHQNGVTSQYGASFLKPLFG